MSEAVLHVKNPQKVAAGQAGMRSRWSDPAKRRVVRIDSLSSSEKAIVLALIEAKKAAIADHDDGPEERRHDSATTTS